MSNNSAKSKICLFDVDGTLTQSRNVIATEMVELLNKLKKKVTVGVVGGSDYSKICEQLGGQECMKRIDFIFSENGIVYHKNGELHSKTSIVDAVGEQKLQQFINYVLGYLALVQLPCKRGTFVEFRTGMINVSPIGRSCSQTERDDFEAYDKIHKVRETMIADLRTRFPDLGLSYAIGGQISFDVFPDGWDKRYCLKHIKDHFSEIHFYGDRVYEGGNDHEIYNDDLTIGHKVTSPAETIRILRDQFQL